MAKTIPAKPTQNTNKRKSKDTRQSYDERIRQSFALGRHLEIYSQGWLEILNIDIPLVLLSRGDLVILYQGNRILEIN